LEEYQQKKTNVLERIPVTVPSLQQNLFKLESELRYGWRSASQAPRLAVEHHLELAARYPFLSSWFYFPDRTVGLAIVTVI
jgi:hypothetical protein